MTLQIIVLDKRRYRAKNYISTKTYDFQAKYKQYQYFSILVAGKMRRIWSYVNKLLNKTDRNWMKTLFIWITSWQNQQKGCAPSKDSDQPGHPPSLIRVFTVRLMGSWGPKLSSCVQRRLCSAGRMPRILFFFFFFLFFFFFFLSAPPPLTDSIFFAYRVF